MYSGNSLVIMKKQKGQFFTHPTIAHFMVREICKSLFSNLFWKPLQEFRNSPSYLDIEKLFDGILSIRIVDPAMGDGVFLIEILKNFEEFILELWHKVHLKPFFGKIKEFFQKRLALDFSLVEKKDSLTLDIWKLHIIRSTIYGVDIDPIVVEKAKERIYSKFSEHIIKKFAIHLLNLNLKTGNSLISFIKNDLDGINRLNQKYQSEISDLILNRSFLQNKIWNEISIKEIHDILSQIDINKRKIKKDFIEYLKTSKKYDYIFKEPKFDSIVFLWELEFPEVFFSSNYGFNVVLGNPPWDKWKLYNREWLGSTSLAKADHAKNVRYLRNKDSTANDEYLTLKSYYKSTTKYYNEYYKWQPGEKNLYKLFLERFYTLCCFKGYFAIIVPGGLLGEYYSQSLRHMLLTKTKIRLIVEGISNEEFFSDVEPGLSILIILVEKTSSNEIFPFIKGIKSAENLLKITLDQLTNPKGDIIFFRRDDILKNSPKQIIPAVRNYMELKVLKKIIMHPVVSSSEWGCKTSRGVDMTNDRDIFGSVPSEVPLIEGRHLIRLGFDITYPRYWVYSYEEYKKRVSFWNQTIIAWKNFSGNHRRRRMRIAIIPPHSAISNSVICLYDLPFVDNIEFYLAGIMCSVPFEFRIRQLCYGLNINQYIIDSMNVPLFNPSNNLHQMMASTVKEFLPKGKEWARRKVEAKSSVSKSKIEVDYINTITFIDALAAHIYKLTKQEFKTTLCAHPKLEKNYKEKALIHYGLIVKNFNKVK